MKQAKIVKTPQTLILEKPLVFTHFNTSSQRESFITTFPLDFFYLR